MKTSKIQSGSFEDIIFDGRNKAYGAYDIRKHYDVHLRTALAIALSMFLLLILSPKIKEQLFPSPQIIVIKEVPLPPMDFTKVVIPKPVIPEEAIQKITPPAPAPSKRYMVPAVVDRILIQEDIPTTQEMLDSKGIISDQNRVGDENPLNIVNNNATGDGSGQAGNTEAEIPKRFVEIMPNFAGGDEALHKFIADHVKYPAMGLEYGLEGTVWVQFVVNKDGKITDPQIVKGIKGGFNEEAIRVIKMMPAWNPGKQNGREVPVYVKIPIKFTISN